MVEDYFDIQGNKIQKGFYQYDDSKEFMYFTGNYGEHGFPIFERERNKGEITSLPNFLVSKLYKINKQDVEKRLNEFKEESKEKISWLEKALKE